MDQQQQKFRGREEILHTFTETEQAQMGHDLANKLGVLNANKEAARESAREFRGVIKDNEAACNDIKRKITSGEEYKYVDTEITFNSPKSGMKSCIRLDTGASLWEREMTVHELQSVIPFPGEELTIIGGTGTDADPYVYKPTSQVTKEDIEGFGERDIQEVPFETEENTEETKDENADVTADDLIS